MLRRTAVCSVLAVLAVAPLRAEVSMLETRHVARAMGAPNKVGDKKKPRPPVRATGSQGLIDNSGLKYFINTNITFSTSSSASAAMSEASYTHAVGADTLNGGTVSSTLNDMFDGYNTLCLSLNNTVATCETGNANFVIYNKRAAATTECAGSVSGVNRQVVFPTQDAGSVRMQRKVFIPDNDSFARWLNYFTNTGVSPQTVTAVIANNLGSDSNTTIVSSSSGNTAAEVADTWVSTFQNFSGTTSSDPRIGHVFQGAGGTVPLAGINFADGDDNPFWGYTFTLNPGETKIIANFVVGSPTRAGAGAKAAALTTSPWPTSARQCLSIADATLVSNFSVSPVPVIDVPALGGPGLGGLALLLLGGAIVMLRRRARYN